MDWESDSDVFEDLASSSGKRDEKSMKPLNDNLELTTSGADVLQKNLKSLKCDPVLSSTQIDANLGRSTEAEMFSSFLISSSEDEDSLLFPQNSLIPTTESAVEKAADAAVAFRQSSCDSASKEMRLSADDGHSALPSGQAVINENSTLNGESSLKQTDITKYCGKGSLSPTDHTANTTDKENNAIDGDKWARGQLLDHQVTFLYSTFFLYHNRVM